MRSAACPSPYNAGQAAGVGGVETALAIAAASSPTSTFAPALTVSTHSVRSRSVTHGGVRIREEFSLLLRRQLLPLLLLDHGGLLLLQLGHASAELEALQ